MPIASCPNCGAETEYDLATCTFNIYKQIECNHIALVCSNSKDPHSFHLFFIMEWLEGIKKAMPPGQRLNIEPHGDAPEFMVNAARTAWHRQPMYDSFDKEIDFFGETGIMFT